MCWVNIHVQSLKDWGKFVLPWLKYSIFARGLFFIGAPYIADFYCIALVFTMLSRVSVSVCVCVSVCHTSVLYQNG